MKASLLTVSLLTVLSIGCSAEMSEEDTTIQREEEIRREDVRGTDQDLPMEYERDVLNQ